MQDNIKYFIRHSFAYGISNVAQKASGIVLVPIYTKYLTTAEYGQLGILLVSIILLAQGLVLGQGQSIIRYSNIEEYKEKRKSIFFTLLVVISIVVILIIVLGQASLGYFAGLFQESQKFYTYLNLSVYIIAAACMNNFLLNKLRADEKSTLYTITGISKLLVNLALTVYLVAFENKGVEGVLYANLASEIAALIIIIPYLFGQIKPSFEKDIIKESFKFGIPLIFSALAMNLLNWSDRYVLKLLTNYSTLGLYELGYKAAGVLNMFIIVPFSLTLLPISYKMYKKEGDKIFYSKILTFFTFLLFWAGLGLAAFSKELIYIFAFDPSFYPSYSVVPLLTLSYCVFGMSLVTALGLYLTGKTNYVAVITILCSVINVVLNFLLIPILGMIGAAINTLIAFLILVILTTLASNKHYEISFEYFRLIKIIFSALVLYFISTAFNESHLAIAVGIKLLALIIFPTLLYVMGFFKREEVTQIKSMILKFKDNLKF